MMCKNARTGIFPSAGSNVTGKDIAAYLFDKLASHSSSKSSGSQRGVSANCQVVQRMGMGKQSVRARNG